MFYNESDVAKETTKLQDDIEYCCKFLIGKKDIKGDIYNTYGKRINLEYDDNNLITKAIPNYSYIEEFKREFGYFWIISNEDNTSLDVINSYKHRDIVEKEMKYSKSLSDLSKIFVTNDTCYEAKTFLGFLGAIIRSMIILETNPYVLQYSSETSQTILLELNKIKGEEINNTFVLRYALTSRQKQLLSLFGLTLKDVYKIIDELNIHRSLVVPKNEC